MTITSTPRRTTAPAAGRPVPPGARLRPYVLVVAVLLALTAVGAVVGPVPLALLVAAGSAGWLTVVTTTGGGL